MAKERLQKLISAAGLASRRQAESWIADGKVKVDGHVASLGDKADPFHQVITVNGTRLERPVSHEHRYIMLNKPRGFVTTMSDQHQRHCVAELIENVGTRVYPVGRLDRQSEGLLILTDDGEMANRLMHPSYHVPKKYRVTVRGKLSADDQDRFATGIELEEGMTQPADIQIISESDERSVYLITLKEGRNRQIRRMMEVLGFEIARLQRVRYGDLRLGNLPVGQWRDLDKKEIDALKRATGQSTHRSSSKK